MDPTGVRQPAVKRGLKLEFSRIDDSGGSAEVENFCRADEAVGKFQWQLEVTFFLSMDPAVDATSSDRRS